MKFSIYTNPQKDKKYMATKKVLAALCEAGCDVYYDALTARGLGLAAFRDAKECDVLFVLGGDGTILQAAHKYVRCDIALVGINFGRLGFMSEIDIDGIVPFIRTVLAGKYRIDERTMLKTRVPRVDEPVLALNDFIITKQSRSKMIRLDLYVNGSHAEHYIGDGLIVSTPTGSTAYSMSAGGPIISPDIACMLITPICPHSMHARSIVANCTDEITVMCVDTAGKVGISADGRKEMPFMKGDAITITTADIKTKFLRVEADNFYSHLKRKLAQWNRTDN